MVYEKNKFTAALGIAFFTQAVTSLVSGTLFLGPFSDKTDMVKLMLDTAGNQTNANISIFLDIITALVIAWLAVLLFNLLRKVNPVWAATALVFYLLEAGILIVSKFYGYAFLQMSKIYSLNNEASFEAIGNVLLKSIDFSYKIHILPFGIGAVLFYGLLAKSRTVPVWLSLWGLITVIPVLIGTILGIYGIKIPFVVNLPYVPFEFFAGVFILIKGVRISNNFSYPEGMESLQSI
jgi:hypothetical protein